MMKPLPFKANFTVRSQRHEEIIRSEWEGVENDVDVILSKIQEQRAGLR